MMTASKSARAQFTIERTYEATLEEAWALWTTKEGIESWWGPEGFDVTVLSLDLRAELFNAFNDVQFAGPNTDITSSSFGHIYLSQVNTPRQVQFSARLKF